MSLPTFIVALHVVIGVLGIGLFGAIPLAAAQARRSALPTADPLLRSLFRYTRLSIVAMLATGILANLAAGGVFHSTWWFRLSIVLLLFLGFSHARAGAQLRRAVAIPADLPAGFRRVERWGWVMCLTVTCIVVLMEAKPF
jgi:hypothetical protein